MFHIQWIAHKWIALLIAAVTLVKALGQDVPPADAEAKSKAVSPLRKLMEESLSWYELFPNDQATQPMANRVVLRWANNVRGSEDGITVLYILNGRPEAVCCVYPWGKSLEHNFGSLSRGRLLAKREGAVVWRPAAAGVEFRPISDAPAPADSPSARLRQMKTLAGQFSSTMLGWRSDSTDREKLRLLPQPLYRYESNRPELIDGSVFAFVQGTDPETLLLIEAVKLQNSTEWQFAFVRRTSGELEGRWNDSVVWHVDRFPANDNPKSAYISLSRPLATTP